MSVADEIAKLQNLRTQGILTDEEFETQKRKLIGTSPIPTATSEADGESLAWSQIPLRRKWWFQVVVTLIIVPVGLTLLVLVPSFRRKKGKIVPVERWFKIIFAVLVVVVWAANLNGIVSGTRTASVPACDSRSAKNVVKDAIERNADGASLRLLDLRDVKELFYDSDKPERLCEGIAVLNSGNQAIRYRLWLSADRKAILGSVRSAN